MHDLVVTHLARRAVQVARHGVRAAATAAEKEKMKEVLEAMARFRSPWTIALLAVTIFAFLAICTAMEYILRFTVGNLTIVENTQNDAALDFELGGLLDDEDETASPAASQKEELDQEYEDTQIPIDDATLGKSEAAQRLLSSGKKLEQGGKPTSNGPITKGVISTLRHVRSIGGYRSFFRGFRAFLITLVFLIAVGVPIEFGLKFLPSFLGEGLSTILVLVAISPFHCAWTHATIRKNPPAPTSNGLHPSPNHATGWRRYVPGFWSGQVILPMARLGLATLVLAYGTGAISKGITSGLRGAKVHPLVALALTLLLPLVYITFMGLLLFIPALIALVRAEAALLPESYQVIVPFDRTFGGRSTTWQKLSWWRYTVFHLSPISAWKTFERETYFRLASVYAKYILFMFVLIILAGITLAAEMYAIVGKHLPTVLVLYGMRTWQF